MQDKKVLIVGAGPGAVDLITVRGLKALEAADFVLYAGSLVNPEHLMVCKDACVKKDSADLALEEQVLLMAEFALEGKDVVRLHTGDPAMYGAINEQISLLAEQGIGIEIIPGVSSVFGAAAALGCELTAPEISQSVVLTRTPGRTPMPNKEKASSFAQTGATLVFFLSTGKVDELTKELCEEGGLPKDTPAAVVYRATWPEELILRGTLEDIAVKVKEAGFGRQALIFVGKALGIPNVNAQKLRAASKLYAKGFSHGYRNSIASERFKGACALYVFSKQGVAKAKEIAQGLKLSVQIYSAVEIDEAGLSNELYPVEYIEKGKMPALLKSKWDTFDAHIFIGATGIAVRYISPLIQSKLYDPAVLSCSDSGSHIVSLVAGHIGGANRLARRVARITGGQAIISTATDIHGLPSFDEVVMGQDARIVNPDSIKYLNAALLAQDPIAFFGDVNVYKGYFEGTCVRHRDYDIYSNTGEITEEFAVCWDTDASKLPSHVQVMQVDSKALVLGIGCKKNVAPKKLREAFEEFIQTHALEKQSIFKIVSCQLKAEEDAILELAKELDVPVEFYSEALLANIPTPNPSKKVLEKVGIYSVSEASALFGAGYPVVSRPYIAKTAYAQSITFSVARIPHGQLLNGANGAEGIDSVNGVICAEKHHGEMVVVGLGSGSYEHITPEVIHALQNCHVVAGYTPYVDFIRSLVADKYIIQNGMMGEMARCIAAMEAAAQGEKVCMVCSGDPGILAMAGLLMELRHERDEFAHIPIRVLPGVTSATIAAASLGAPLQNGFCLVSLSDLLVPTEEVRMNLQSVAKSELPVTLYNPAGKKRRTVMAEALQIFMDARGKNTLCAYVKNAGREMETKWVGKISDFPQDDVDMSTLIIIGGKRTKYDGEYLYEARGYIDKYADK